LGTSSTARRTTPTGEPVLTLSALDYV
jgi:hypothetical protein